MTAIPKDQNFRSKKFLALARGERCWLEIHGVCNLNNETVVPCHSPDFERMHGKLGYTVKAHDLFFVPGCSSCHDYIDNRTHHEVSVEMKQQDFNRAHANWILHCIKKGFVKIL